MTASALALSESQLFQKVHFYINFIPHKDIAKTTPPLPQPKNKLSSNSSVKSEYFDYYTTPMSSV